MINKTIIFIMAGVLLLATFMTFSFQPKNNFVSFSEETIETINSPEYLEGQIKLGLVEFSEPREPTRFDKYTGINIKDKNENQYKLYHSYSIKEKDYGKVFIGK